MTLPTPRPRPPASRPTRPDRRPAYWPDASKPSGAVLYAAIGALIACVIINIVSHIHIAITWH
jgi:hypothetical protein